MNSPNPRTTSITVVGSGSWGTAIGAWLARNGHDLRIWDIDTSVIDDINATHCNNRYLPDCKLPENLVGYRALESAMTDCSTVVTSSPKPSF